jgi:uncharacterized protein (DUF433 family)
MPELGYKFVPADIIFEEGGVLVAPFYEGVPHADYSRQHLQPGWYFPGPVHLLLMHDLEAAQTRYNFSRDLGQERDIRYYNIPLAEAFGLASKEYPGVTADPGVMAGAPCISGTRIPVYMVLDAIEYYGSLEGAHRSYPKLTIQQIKDAIGFAKLVVECPIDDEITIASR